MKECPTRLTLDEKIKAPYLLDRKVLDDFKRAVAKFRKTLQKE